LDRRQGDIDDRHVEARHEHAQTTRRQHHRTAPRATISTRRGADRCHKHCCITPTKLRGADPRRLLPPFTPAVYSRRLLPPFTPAVYSRRLLPPFTPAAYSRRFLPPFTPAVYSRRLLPPFRSVCLC